jgi:hypothetical protein
MIIAERFGKKKMVKGIVTNKWLLVNVQVAGKEILSCKYEAFIIDVRRYLDEVLWMD